MLRTRIWIGLVAAGLSAGCTEAKGPPAAPTAPATSGAQTPASGLAAAPDGPGKKFSLDNGKIEFTGSKPDGKHEGGFNEFVGYAVPAEGEKLLESITVDINTGSMWSDDSKLTGHLMSPDFFDVKQHPKATFVSKAIEPAAGGHKVTGDLTLLGTTKTIEFPASIARNGDNIDFNADFEISRKEFGMTYGEGKVDDPVKIKASFSVPANEGPLKAN